MATSHSTRMNSTATSIPAVGYIRMSTDKQEDSPEQQRAEIIKLANRHGYRVMRWYEDHGISGAKTLKRLQFRQMIRDAEDCRDFRAILCWDQDRFGRFDSIEAGEWISPLRRVGVELVTVAQGRIDWDDFAGRMICRITQEGKHRCLVDLSKNSLRGMIRFAKAGHLLGMPTPYGYERVYYDASGKEMCRIRRRDKFHKPRDWKVKLVPSSDRREVETIQWMFCTFAETDCSARALAVELNRRKVPSPTDGEWSWTFVKKMLRHPGIEFETLDVLMDRLRVSGEELVPAVAKMDEFLLSAGNGSREANQALREMGSSLEELQQASQGDRVMMLADGLSRISDAGLRIARQRDVFGRGGRSLNIEGGATGIHARAERDDELEGVQTPEMLRQAQEYNVAMREMKMATNGIWMSLGAAAAPVMTDFFRMITQIVVGVRQWMDANRPLLTMIFYFADKLILLGTIIGFVGSAVYAASYALAFVSGAISIVGGVISTFLSLASGGFGLLTVLSWGRGIATFAAGMVASGALLVYKVG